MAMNKVKINSDVELKDRLVAINRVTKVTKGGRTFTFAAIVVVGDGNGVIGWGLGKAGEVTAAIAKGVEAAKKNVIRVPLVNGYRTIPHPIVGVYGAGEVVLKPASEGTGVIAGGAIRDVLELAGCTDVVTKCVGSRTSINMVRATFAGLKSLKTVNSVAKVRGLKVEEVR